MFPVVHKSSMIALKKFCANKHVNRTAKFLNDIWDSSALNKMMSTTATTNLDALARWLVDSDNKTKKIQLINNYYNN